jgi:hypothetical protein
MTNLALPPPPAQTTGSSHDLASLACDAAIEIDNLLTDPNQPVSAVRVLAERLTQELPDATDLTCPKYLVDPSMVTVMSRAISESSLAGQPTEMRELTRAAGQIARLLVGVSDDPPASRSDPRLLELLRSFCLLLSKVAAASRQSGGDNKPQHPYRKQW